MTKTADDDVHLEAHEPGGPAREGNGALSASLLLALGLLTTFAPFAMDMYLPAFPAMTGALGTSAAGVQITLTAFLVGAAVGQLVFGSLSDRYGRRAPLLVGAAVCVASSLVAAFAPGLAVLAVARLVQGLSGAAGMVIGRAVVSDLAKGREAARAFSLMMLVTGVAPVVAPLAGSLLVGSLGWRGLLGVVAAIAAAMLVAVLLVVPESHPVDRRATAGSGGLRGSGLGSRAFVAHTITFVFGFGALMAFIASSPFVYQVIIGVGPVTYGLLFGLNALAMTVVGSVSAHLAHKVGPARLLSVGVGVMTAGALLLGALVWVGAAPWWYAVPLFVVVASLGLVMGNATALALAAVRGAAGKGSAVLGALQFALAGVVTAVVGLGGEGTAVPLAAVLVVVTLVASSAHVVALRSGRTGVGRTEHP